MWALLGSWLMAGPDVMSLDINSRQPRALGGRLLGGESIPHMPGGEGERDGLTRPEPWLGALVGGNASGRRMSGADCLKADWMFMKVPSVGTGDSSSLSETLTISSGSNLRILQKVFSFLTWQLFKMTV